MWKNYNMDLLGTEGVIDYWGWHDLLYNNYFDIFDRFKPQVHWRFLKYQKAY